MSWLQRLQNVDPVASDDRCCFLACAKQKRQRPEPLPLCQTALSNALELLDQSGIPEPAQVIIGAARNAEGVAKLEPKLLGWVLTEDIVYSHGDGGVVQDILPARHTINS